MTDEHQTLAQAIGARARRARLALQLTQAEVAGQIGLKPESYARIERGHALPSMGTLKRLCVTLEISADTLLKSDRLASGADGAEDLLSRPPEALSARQWRELESGVRRASPQAIQLIRGLLKVTEEQ